MEVVLPIGLTLSTHRDHLRVNFELEQAVLTPTSIITIATRPNLLNLARLVRNFTGGDYAKPARHLHSGAQLVTIALTNRHSI